MLVAVTIPHGSAADAISNEGLNDMSLPDTHPVDANGRLIPHATCQPVGHAAFAAGLDGVVARSAAPGGDRELAWFPRGRTPASEAPAAFEDWW